MSGKNVLGTFGDVSNWKKRVWYFIVPDGLNMCVCWNFFFSQSLGMMVIKKKTVHYYVTIVKESGKNI